MIRYIEFYEVKTKTGIEYWYMPVDAHAKNKENVDSRSSRIWKLNVATDRFYEVMNRSENKTLPNRVEFIKIQLMAMPVPYDEYYLKLEEVKRHREQREAEKSATKDQV